MEADAAILILNYNAGEALVRCLDSLAASDARQLPILLVDNASTDGSTRAAKAARPDVEILQEPDNGGFARGVNAGLRRLLRGRSRAILVLNPDTRVAPDFFAPLSRALAAGAVLCGPKLLLPGPPTRIWAAGGAATFGLNLCRLRGHGLVDRGQFDRAEEVSFLPGTTWLMARRLIEKVGLLDEGFFLYLEDLDYCLRARAAGLSLWYEPSSRVEHFSSSSSGGGYTALRKYLNAFGSRRLLEKHATVRQWVKFLLCDVLSLPLALGRGVLLGQTRAALWKLRGLIDGFRGRPLDPDLVARLVRNGSP